MDSNHSYISIESQSRPDAAFRVMAKSLRIAWNTVAGHMCRPERLCIASASLSVVSDGTATQLDRCKARIVVCEVMHNEWL